MSNSPQIRAESITLQPHPLDAWRHALGVLIACAPGNPADVAFHLRDAAMGMRTKPHVSSLEARLVQRLLIPADVQTASRVIGEPLSIHRKTTPASEQPRVQTAPQASGGHVAALAESRLLSPPLLPGEALVAPTHSPALPAFGSDRP